MIGPVTKELLEKSLNELNTEKNKKKIQDSFVIPMLDIVYCRIKPFLFSLIMCIIILLLLILIAIIYMVTHFINTDR